MKAITLGNIINFLCLKKALVTMVTRYCRLALDSWNASRLQGSN